MSSVHQILPPGSLLAVWTSHVSLRVVHSCDQGRLLPTLSPTMGSLQTRTEDTTDPVGLTELICSKLKDEVPNVPTLWSQQKHQIKKTTKLSRNHSNINIFEIYCSQMSLSFFGFRKSPHFAAFSHFDGLSLWSLRLQRSFACHHLCSASSHTFTTGQTSPLGVGIAY